MLQRIGCGVPVESVLRTTSSVDRDRAIERVLGYVFPKNDPRQQRALVQSNEEEKNVDIGGEVLHKYGRLICSLASRRIATGTSGGKGRVEICTHCSLDRTDDLRRMCASWDGNVVAAVYASEHVDWKRLAPLPRNLTLVHVYRDDAISASHEVGCLRGRKCQCAYPINALRNFATRASTAEFVLYLDVDLVPSLNLCRRLEETSSLRDLRSSEHSAPEACRRTAWIVPAFEIHRPCPEQLPRTRRSLKILWTAGIARGFQMFRYSPGHRATNHEAWMTSSKAYDVRYENGFEPYAIVSRASLPEFDERFSGYGKNKTAHTLAMHGLGFRFRVIPHGFVVSRVHARSREWYRTYHPTARCLRRRNIVNALYGNIRNRVSTTPPMRMDKVGILQCRRRHHPRHLLIVAPAASGKSYTVSTLLRGEACVADADRLIGELIGWDALAKIPDTPRKNRRMWEELFQWLGRQRRPTALYAPPYGGVSALATYQGFLSEIAAAIAVLPNVTTHKLRVRMRADDVRQGRVNCSKPHTWQKIARHRREIAAQCTGEAGGAVCLLRDVDLVAPFRAWKDSFGSQSAREAGLNYNIT